MSVFEAIHDRWEAATALEALLPAARLFTGQVTTTGDQPTLPYATVGTLANNASRTYSNSSKWNKQGIRFVLYHDVGRLAATREIIEAILDAFDRSAFPIDASSEVENLQLTGEPEVMQDDFGRWYATVDFVATTRLD